MSIDVPDPERLARARTGDHDALGALLQAHAPALSADLRPRIPPRWSGLITVEDILQETFTDAFLSIRKFTPRGDGSLAVWLKKLAHNNLLEAIRALEADKRGGGRRPLSLSAAPDAHTTLFGTLMPQAVQTSPSQHLAREDVRRALAAALAQLPARYRLVIERHDLQGRPIGEAAAELQCSPGGAHLVRNRAMDRLRALLSSSFSTSRQEA